MAYVRKHDRPRLSKPQKARALGALLEFRKAHPNIPREEAFLFVSIKTGVENVTLKYLLCRHQLKNK